MDKFNIKSFFVKHYKNPVRVNPHRHWIYILNFFFVMLFLLVVSSFYLLYEIKNDNIFNGKLDLYSKNVLISRNEKLLNNVKNYFNLKAQKMESLKNDKLQLEDPRFKK